MKVKTTLHFYAKSTKSNSAGLFPIYVRLTVDGKRLEYSTKKFIDPAKWSLSTSRMKGNSEEARSINSILDLSKANENRNYKIFEEFANHLILITQDKKSNEDF